MLAVRFLLGFGKSLDAIEANLAIYMGVKQAVREMKSLLGDL